MGPALALVGRRDISEHRHKKSLIDHRLAVAEDEDMHLAQADGTGLVRTPSVAAVDPFSILRSTSGLYHFALDLSNWDSLKNCLLVVKFRFGIDQGWK